MFKVNNEDFRVTSLTLFWGVFYCEVCTDFKHFSIVPIIDFEQVNNSWATFFNFERIQRIIQHNDLFVDVNLNRHLSAGCLF